MKKLLEKLPSKLKSKPLVAILLVAFVIIGFVCIKRFILKRPPNTEVNPHDHPPLPDQIGGAIKDNPDSIANVAIIASSGFIKNDQEFDEKTSHGNAHAGGKPDKVPPTVAITYSGGVVSIGANDNVGVVLVTCSTGGAQIYSATQPPFQFTYTIEGTHLLTAIASDKAGNKGMASISVTINPIPQPTIEPTVTPPPDTIPTPSPLPPTVRINEPSVQNQSPFGSCVPFAEEYYQLSVEYKSIGAPFSPAYPYNILLNGTCSAGNGLALINNYNFQVNNGSVHWTSFPYDGTTCSIPATSLATEAAQYKIKTYNQVLTADIVAMKTLLANGHPLVFTFAPDHNFYYGTDDLADHTIYTNNNYVWHSYSTELYGPHCITICGYDDAKHAYLTVNQWGVNWGDAGYRWVDYDFLPHVSYECYTIGL